MSKRMSLEIMAEILSVCKQPQNKTRIMYKTNLSYKTLKKYLVQLQSLGLLKLHHSLPRYIATEKGLCFLQKWAELTEFLNSTEEYVSATYEHAPNKKTVSFSPLSKAT